MCFPFWPRLAVTKINFLTWHYSRKSVQWRGSPWRGQNGVFQWQLCPVSVKLCPDTEWRREGQQVLHDLLEMSCSAGSAWNSLFSWHTSPLKITRFRHKFMGSSNNLLGSDIAATSLWWGIEKSRVSLPSCQRHSDTSLAEATEHFEPNISL